VIGHRACIAFEWWGGECESICNGFASTRSADVSSGGLRRFRTCVSRFEGVPARSRALEMKPEWVMNPHASRRSSARPLQAQRLASAVMTRAVPSARWRLEGRGVDRDFDGMLQSGSRRFERGRRAVVQRSLGVIRLMGERRPSRRSCPRLRGDSALGEIAPQHVAAVSHVCNGRARATGGDRACRARDEARSTVAPCARARRTISRSPRACTRAYSLTARAVRAHLVRMGRLLPWPAM
jgi:hypothetical protein